MKKLIVAAAMVAVMGAAQARSAVPLIEPARVALTTTAGKTLTEQGVHDAIVKAAGARKWIVREDKPGKLVLLYSKESGKHEVVVDLAYDAQGFQFSYVSSLNMKYEEVNGVKEIHPFYNKWVDALSKDIVTEVSR